jgi:predicted transcriptional regulator
MDIDTNLPDMNDLFEAVLDSDRLSLIAYLSQKELSLSELSIKSKMPPKDIQRHLQILESANLVKVRD